MGRKRSCGIFRIFTVALYHMLILGKIKLSKGVRVPPTGPRNSRKAIVKKTRNFMIYI